MPYALLGSQPGWSERPHGMGSTKMAITTGCLGGFSSILVVSPRWKEIPSIHCWLFRRSVVIVPDFASDPRSRFPISMFLTFLTLSHPAFSPCFPLFSHKIPMVCWLRWRSGWARAKGCKVKPGPSSKRSPRGLEKSSWHPATSGWTAGREGKLPPETLRNPWL